MEHLLVTLATLLALGLAAQWLAWRLRVPGILLLLAFGFFAGPEWLGWLDSDELLGDLLFPVVSASVGIILFEGGLSLRMADFREHGGVVTRLCTVGAVVTWALSAIFAYWLLPFDAGMATLFGAILIVSGPTVVLPLLRHIKPKGPSGTILTWEGIAIDPVGAVLAVLVFEGLSMAGVGVATRHGVVGVVWTIFVGGGLGLFGGWILAQALRRYWVPDHLHNAFALALVVAVFAASNVMQHEAGLLAVTVMGFVAANTRGVSLHHIVEFKENLRVLLISSLFLLLAARVRKEDLAMIDGEAFAFLGALLFVVRPMAVIASTWGSSLTRNERIFLAWLCPRGIVAAAVASVFGLRLMEGNVPEAARLVPLTFLVIVGTVVVYGLTAPILARRLGLAEANPQGILFIGAGSWVRDLAKQLQALGVKVLLADTNQAHIRAARMAGLPSWRGNVIEDHAHESLDLSGIGRALVLTPNDEVNTLVAQHFMHEFGRSNTFTVPRDRMVRTTTEAPGWRVLFGPDEDFFAISKRFARDAKVRATTLTDQFGMDAFVAHHGDKALPLISVAPTGAVSVASVDSALRPAAGHTVLAIVEGDAPDPPGVTTTPAPEADPAPGPASEPSQA